MVKYFYIQAVNKKGRSTSTKPSSPIPEPNPFTLEQAILMMSDAVEASSRSLKDYSVESITELVNRIVDGQVASGAFANCPITFRGILEAKQTFIDSLKVIYHAHRLPRAQSSRRQTHSPPAGGIATPTSVRDRATMISPLRQPTHNTNPRMHSAAFGGFVFVPSGETKAGSVDHTGPPARTFGTSNTGTRCAP